MWSAEQKNPKIGTLHPRILVLVRKLCVRVLDNSAGLLFCILVSPPRDFEDFAQRTAGRG